MHENHQFTRAVACLPRKTHLLMVLENIAPGLVNGTSTLVYTLHLHGWHCPIFIHLLTCLWKHKLEMSEFFLQGCHSQSFSRGCLSDSVVRSINAHIASNCIATSVTRKIKRNTATIILGDLRDRRNLEYRIWFSCLLVLLFTNPADCTILLRRKVVSVTASCT